MDLFRAKKIKSKYTLKKIQYQPFEQEYQYRRGQQIPNQLKIPPQQHYKLLSSPHLTLNLPQEIQTFNKGPIQNSHHYKSHLNFPLTALGLLLVKGENGYLAQIGAIFKQNYVISTYHQQFQEGSRSLTFYPAFNMNQYIKSYSAKVIKKNKENTIAFLQIQTSDNLELIFGKIAIKADQLHTVLDNKRNQEDETDQRYNRPRRERIYRQPFGRPQAPPIPNTQEVWTFYFDLQSNFQLAIVTLPASSFNKSLTQNSPNGICLGFHNNEYSLIGVHSQKTYFCIDSEDLLSFGNILNQTNYQLDCASMYLSEHQCIWILQKRWRNLTEIDLTENSIKPSLCLYLSNVQWPQIQSINLSKNPLGSEGIFWLIKASFPQLQDLQLRNTLIDDSGCERLSNSKWPNLKRLNIATNMIREEGCKWLSEASWPKLVELNIKKNFLRGGGCKYLVNAPWRLQKIELSSCMIDDNGCKWLIRSKWDSLSHLDLQENFITSVGCKWLKKGNWKNLATFLLMENEGIKRQGFEHISKMNCRNLHKLSINIDNECLLSNYNLLKVQFPYLCIILKGQTIARVPRRDRQTGYNAQIRKHLEAKFKYLTFNN